VDPYDDWSDHSITGNDGDNVLNGGPRNDSINGGAGADFLNGGPGNDSINGGAGADDIYYEVDTGYGIDTIDGGADHDTLDIVGAPAYFDDYGKGYDGNSWLDVVVVDGAITSINGGTVVSVESVMADLGDGRLPPNHAGMWANDEDALYYAGTTEAVTVNLATGTATGFTSIADVEDVFGGSGNDVLTGDAGANWLVGGDGADSLDGGDDPDRLEGGGNQDILTGGLGADTFVFRSTADSVVGAPDVITDWVKAPILSTLPRSTPIRVLTATRTSPSLGSARPT
jgi:Ca2+-binding RTX toxin-like protein